MSHTKNRYEVKWTGAPRGAIAEYPALPEATRKALQQEPMTVLRRIAARVGLTVGMFTDAYVMGYQRCVPWIRRTIEEELACPVPGMTMLEGEFLAQLEHGLSRKQAVKFIARRHGLKQVEVRHAVGRVVAK